LDSQSAYFTPFVNINWLVVGGWCLIGKNKPQNWLVVGGWWLIGKNKQQTTINKQLFRLFRLFREFQQLLLGW
jgi:hypothetical protein